MSMPNLIAGIERVDDLTVTFLLARPEAAFLADLAMDFASILSKEYADQLKAADGLALLNQQPIGTGPFQFIGYDKDAVVRLKANPAYWGGKPKLDDLTFKITPDPAERVKKLKAGECHVIADPEPKDIEGLKKESGVSVMQIENPDIAYLAYNTTQKPFDDPRVRRALNMAIDKQAIVETVYGGDAKVAKSPLPPTMWSYNAALADDAYDPDAARKLLEEAGVKDLQMRIWAMPASRPYNPDSAKTAEMIKADFAKIGVTVKEIVSPDVGEYLRTSSAKDRDGAVLLGWTGDNGDPDNFLPVLLGCDGVGISNRAQWCAPTFQDLVVKAEAVTDQAERARLYAEAQAIFKEQAPWATLAHSLATVAMTDKVIGYKMDPLGHHRFDKVDLAE
jgi:dipeptide transport system substrate-binding protein